MNNSLEGNILFLNSNLLQKIFFFNQLFIFLLKKYILNNTYSFTKNSSSKFNEFDIIFHYQIYIFLNIKK